MQVGKSTIETARPYSIKPPLRVELAIIWSVMAVLFLIF